ncbi:hypothetical protein ACXR2U_22245 [Jatrophihabitans sp. YIM 134969]
MSAPVDEIDVGRDPRARAPWHRWSRRRRQVVGGVALVVVLAAGALWLALRPSDPAPTARAVPPVALGAPGADVVQTLPPDVASCPPTAETCAYDDDVDPADEQAFRAAFGSAGYIGRQTVRDAETAEVYLQLIRFTTGTLVTVTLTQQPVALLPEPPVVDDDPTDVDRRDGGFTLTAVRDGYLITVTAAGLPGQVLPVRAAQQWVRTAPAP